MIVAVILRANSRAVFFLKCLLGSDNLASLLFLDDRKRGNTFLRNAEVHA